ncbi:hypothetical protein H8959_001129 [Pygathrix nigripes]
MTMSDRIYKRVNVDLWKHYPACFCLSLSLSAPFISVGALHLDEKCPPAWGIYQSEQSSCRLAPLDLGRWCHLNLRAAAGVLCRDLGPRYAHTWGPNDGSCGLS